MSHSMKRESGCYAGEPESVCIPNASVVANVSDSCLFVFCLFVSVCLLFRLNIYLDCRMLIHYGNFLKTKLLLLLLLFVFIPTIPLENSNLVNKNINIKGNGVTNKQQKPTIPS